GPHEGEEGVERMTRARGAAAVLLLTGLIGAGVAAPAGAAPRAQLDALAQKVDRVESVREIKDLDRSFAQYAQFGQHKKMAQLFAANGTLQWGDEVVTGRKAIERWLAEEAGAMNGVGPGSLNLTIVDNPLVNLSASGHTAEGRWNGMRFL